MGTTKNDLSEWFDRGVEQGATHMVVVCDTFDYDDYPVYVMPGEDPRKKADEANESSMQKVMEVYNLRADKKIQLEQRRVFNFD